MAGRGGRESQSSPHCHLSLKEMTNIKPKERKKFPFATTYWKQAKKFAKNLGKQPEKVFQTKKNHVSFKLRITFKIFKKMSGYFNKRNMY